MIKLILRILVIFGISLIVLRQLNQGWLAVNNPSRKATNLLHEPHIALIDLKGPIWGSFDNTVLSTADSLLPTLRGAFYNPHTVAIVLRINSPGGTTVQSHQVSSEIKRLRKLYPTVPVYAVCEEICTSAAYHIASACHKIYANPASIIGSLGVTLSGAGFGYEKALKKLGIERRVITAGDRKNMLDPYLPLNKEEVDIIREIQAELHQLFIEAVKEERGERLKNLEKNNKELFSGRTWTGKQALHIGLIDELGGIELVQSRFKVEVINYTPKPNWLLQMRKVLDFNTPTSKVSNELFQGLLEPLMGLNYSLVGIRDAVSGLT